MTHKEVLEHIFRAFNARSAPLSISKIVTKASDEWYHIECFVKQGDTAIVSSYAATTNTASLDKDVNGEVLLGGIEDLNERDCEQLVLICASEFIRGKADKSIIK
jgi:hypothetical protein